jgi:hypothetical protein
LLSLVRDDTVSMSTKKTTAVPGRLGELTGRAVTDGSTEAPMLAVGKNERDVERRLQAGRLRCPDCDGCRRVGAGRAADGMGHRLVPAYSSTSGDLSRVWLDACVSAGQRAVASTR